MVNQKNKFAFVTGTSSGLGEAAANELLSRGWIVFGASRRDVSIKYPNYRHFIIDLSDLVSAKSTLSKELIEQLKNQNIERIGLVNNAAGVGETVRVEEFDPVELQKLFTINVVMPVWLMGLFYKNSLSSAKLRIINISSGAAYKAYPGLADYGSTKAALKLIGNTFAEEHTDNKNLAVLSYEPGVVDTEMQKTVRSKSPQKFPSVNFFKSLADNNRLVKPEIVAVEMADFLEAEDRTGFTEARFGIKT
jgi:benzil reductase ((S)-benzoin forming)